MKLTEVIFLVTLLFLTAARGCLVVRQDTTSTELPRITSTSSESFSKSVSSETPNSSSATSLVSTTKNAESSPKSTSSQMSTTSKDVTTTIKSSESSHSSLSSTVPPIPQNCNSCDSKSLKLVSRNNTPAPVIMGTFHEDGCLVTVVACDIPECSDAVLDSYRPDGTFKRVTNSDGTVWPHLEMKCSPDGTFLWDGEIQTEFSCYAEDCYIPTITPESTVSWTTNSLNFTETTGSTVSLASTTTDHCHGYCTNVDSVFISDSVKFERPTMTKISNEDCGQFSVECKTEDGQICSSVVLYHGSTILLESESSIQYNISCNGNHYTDITGIQILNNKLFCKFKNCVEALSTSTVSSSSTPEPSSSTLLSSTLSLAQLTTSEGTCSSCNILSLFNYADRTDKFQPWYYDILTTDCSCKAYAISCELYDVDICDIFEIRYISDDDSEYALAESVTNKVVSEIACQANGKFAGSDRRVIKEIFCRSTNCRKS